MKYINILIIAVILLSFGISAYYLPIMPDMMASHWGIDGQVNGYMPKAAGLFMVPVISLLLFALFTWLPKIDPLKNNVDKFRKYFDGFVLAIISFLLYVHILTIMWSLGWRFDMGRALSPAFAALFYVAGVLISHAKRNWFIGIRTPWTLSSDHVWDKTHKLGGKLFKVVAVLALVPLLVPSVFALALIIVPVLIATIWVIVYSYVEFKKVK